MDGKDAGIPPRAIGYAARFPGGFKAAASFSGALDLGYPGKPGVTTMAADRERCARPVSGGLPTAGRSTSMRSFS